MSFFFFNDTATTEIYTLSLHDALPIYLTQGWLRASHRALDARRSRPYRPVPAGTKTQPLEPGKPTAFDIAILPLRSEEHTSELQSRLHLVCRLLLEKKKNKQLLHHLRH